MLDGNDSPYLFFFTKHHLLSNWNRQYFTVKGVEFNCVEQFMMYCKAKLFGDEEKAAEIMASDDPAVHKQKGREVKNFVKEVWDEKCEQIVYIGCLEKARQNPKVKAYILGTKDRILVEASEFDRIWGVGLSAEDPRIQDPTKWRGQNRLGHVQMRVRATLQKEEKEA